MPTHEPRANLAFAMPTHEPRASLAFTMPTHEPRANLTFHDADPYGGIERAGQSDPEISA
jgi:hypothetical protein